MIYLTLNVKNIESSINFYVNKLSMFNLIGDRRLECKFDAKLILDLREKTPPNPTNFGIRFERLSVMKLINKNNIPHKVENNLAGSHLYIEDPDKNEIWITTENGEIN